MNLRSNFSLVQLHLTVFISDLKIARAKYLQFQNAIRRDMLAKRMEKEHGRVIDELIWRAPKESRCLSSSVSSSI